MTDETASLNAKAGVDTTDFKNGVSSMNRAIRDVEAGFKASAAELGNWSNVATGLEQRIDAVSKILDIQKQKVAATKAEYEKLVAEKGADDEQTQKALTKYNLAVGALGKYELELQKTSAALDDVRVKTSPMSEAMDQLDRSLRLEEAAWKADAAAIGDWKNSAGGLQGRMGSLESQIDLQTKKLTEMRAQQDLINQTYGESSKQADEYRITVLKETETLNKMKGELGDTEKALDTVNKSSAKTGVSIGGMGGATDSLTKQLGLLKITIPGLSEETGVLEFTLGGVVVEMNLLDVAVAVVAAGIAVLVAGVAAGVAVFVATTAAAIAAAKGITDLVVSSADAADKLAELSAQLGISTTKLQEMDYTGKALGTSLETFTGSQAKLIRSMDAATTQTDAFGKSQDKANEKVANAQKAYLDAVASYGEGSKQAESAAKKLSDAQSAAADVAGGPVQAAFEKLGVKVRDASGNLRDSQTVFGETLDALKKIENPTERDALSMQIFGKSAQELNPLIDAGSDGLKRYADEAHKMGAVVDTETINALSGFKDKLDSIDSGLKGVGETIAGVFLPYFDGIASEAQTQLAGLAAAVNGSVGLRQTVKSVGNWLISASDDFAKSAPEAVANMAKTLNQNLPFLIKSAVTAVSTIVGTLIKMLPDFLSIGFTAMRSLGQGIQSNLPGLIKTATTVIPQIISELATNLPDLIQMGADIFTTLANGLTTALPKITPEIAKLIDLITTVLVENLPTLILVGIQLITALVQGFAAAAPILVPLGPKLIKTFVDALLINKVALIKAAGDLIATLVIGFINQIPYIIQGVFTLLVTVLDVVIDYVRGGFFADIGVALVQGIWQGIQDSWDTLVSNFLALIGQLPAAIQKLLGLSGTSGTGIQSAGLNRELGRVREQMNQALNGFASGAALAGAGGPSVSNQATDNSFNLQARTVIIQGNQAPGSVKQAIMQQTRKRY